MNITKLIYKAVSLGYPGNPNETDLMDIQDWIITKYGYVPYIKWNTKHKYWEAYVYEFDYDSVTWLKSLIAKANLSTKEATQKLDNYIKTECMVSDVKGNTSFIHPQDALYYAVEKAMNMGFKLNK